MSARRNIIFLDFDGVITTVRSHWAIDGKKCRLIKKLCDAANAKIVISSSWRYNNLEDTIKKNKLDNWVLKEYVIDVTERLIMRGSTEGGHVGSVPRGVEIDVWLDNNEYKNYVIFDDDSDMLLSQKDNFVKTDSMNGVTLPNIKKAYKILTGKSWTGI